MWGGESGRNYHRETRQRHCLSNGVIYRPFESPPVITSSSYVFHVLSSSRTHIYVYVYTRESFVIISRYLFIPNKKKIKLIFVSGLIKYLFNNLNI